jgi:sugar lactone lactonase YvrE
VDSIVRGPSAKVYRVDPATLGGDVRMLGSADEWASGLSPINGCAFGPDGTFYASALFTGFGQTGPTGGDVVALRWDAPGKHISLTGGTLPFAGGVAVAADGTVYAVGLTAFAPTGFVARLANR